MKTQNFENPQNNLVNAAFLKHEKISLMAGDIYKKSQNMEKELMRK